MNKTANTMYENFAGNNNIEEIIIKQNEEYKKLNDELKTVTKELRKKLNENEMRLMLEYSDILTSINAMETREYYIQGFQDGISSK